MDISRNAFPSRPRGREGRREEGRGKGAVSEFDNTYRILDSKGKERRTYRCSAAS